MIYFLLTFLIGFGTCFLAVAFFPFMALRMEAIQGKLLYKWGQKLLKEREELALKIAEQQEKLK